MGITRFTSGQEALVLGQFERMAHSSHVTIALGICLSVQRVC